jgi:hypothetical protein
MKRFKDCLFLLVLVLIFSEAAAVENKTGSSDIDNSVNRLNKSLQDYFTPLEGVIEDVDRIQIKVRLEDGAKVIKGMRLSIYRPGEIFYHPVTKEPMGRSENFIGRVEIEEEEADQGLYLCSLVEGDAETGDKVRITSSRIKLAFFQKRKSDWALSELFYGQIKNSGRFAILESYAPSFKPEDLSVLARELGAQAFLLFSTPVRKPQKIMNVQLYWARDTKKFAELEEVVSDSLVEAVRTDEKFISSAIADTAPWGSYELKAGSLVALGDVDGNGETEFVISDGNNIRIYRMKGELQEQWLIKGSNQEKHLSIDIIDLNGNGIEEIFVTSLIDREGLDALMNDSYKGPSLGMERVMSYVIEYEPSDGYRKIADNLPYFTRVSGNKLLMQRYNRKSIFRKPVYEAEWKDGGYKPSSPLDLPLNVNIYGFTFVDWKNDGHVYLAAFDAKGYLIVYDEKLARVWKSGGSYGKFALSFKKETSSLVNPLLNWSVKGRLIPLVTDRGQEIIVVNKVPLVSKVPGLGSTGGEVYSLWWDGAIMDEKLILSEVPGTISDYWIEDNHLFIVASGDMLSFVKNAASGEFTKGSVLYYYNFGKK